jgi:hypothetical protein
VLYIILLSAVVILIVGIGFVYFSAKEKKEINKEVINKFIKTEVGAVNTQLLFADENKIIFYDRPALMVYDIVNKKIIRTIDFQEVGVKYFQGDDAYSIYASKEGNKVFFEKANQMNRFIYDVEKNTIRKNLEKENELFKKENYFNSYMQGVELDTDEFIPISKIIKVNDEQYIYLINSSSSILEDLEIVIVKNMKKEIIPIFKK